MSSVIQTFEYDIFLSYRHNDNAYDGWVTEFAANLKRELEATVKVKLSIYFDENSGDGLRETDNVDESLSTKVKSLIFVPIISQTYCDPDSFAWRNEFLAFNKMTSLDHFGPTVRLSGGNVSNRVLPVKIHDIDAEDVQLLERELGTTLRPIEFIYKSPGVNRPLRPKDDDLRTHKNQFIYRDQINKVANAIKEIIVGLKSHGTNLAKPSKEMVDREGNVTDSRNRSRYRLAMGISALAIGLFAAYAVYNKRPPIPQKTVEKSIAVLPFVNLTNDRELDVFCGGVTEEILNHLSKVAALHVTSRTSVGQFKISNLTIPEIAKKLGVSYILEGSVRRSGEKARITVQLIDATTDKHVWSEDYDYHEFKDIFLVQTDVSTRVAEKLTKTLTPREKESLSKIYTGGEGAYKLYLRGRFFWDKRTRESYDSAEALYYRAIGLDSGYALAYSGLADCYIFNQKGLKQLEAIPKAKLFAEKALSLDTNLCEAWTTLGFIQSHFDYQWEQGRQTLEKALTCNPNYAIAHMYLGNILLSKGRIDEGLNETKKALRLDPLSSSVNMVLGRNYYHARRYDSALNQLRITLSMDPDSRIARLNLCRVYSQKGLLDKSIDAIGNVQYPKASPEINADFLVCYAYGHAGDKTRAQAELRKILDKGISHPYGLALAYVGLGDFDKALSSLEKAYDGRNLPLIFLPRDPALDPLRNDPRFKSLLKKMNLN